MDESRESQVTILFLNAGRRVELIRCFRQAFQALGLEGRIVTTDITGLAPALYLGDARYILPHSSDAGFPDRIREVCEREGVRAVVPLIDPDLPALARHREAIEEIGARVLLSGEDAIRICSDKVATYRFLKDNGFPTPEVFTLEEAESRPLPLFVKPRDGSASVNAVKVSSRSELEFFAQYIRNAMIQEFVDGEEITTDVFSDWSGEPMAAIPRRRLKTRAGEVSIARVVRDAKLEDLCERVARRLGTVGPINIQTIRCGDSIYVVEINPRFGGGCPLAMAAGAPLARWTLMMALDRPLDGEVVELKDGLTMMRYDDSVFREWGQLQ